MVFQKGEHPGVEFKPGESGNPNGRPVGSISLTTTLKKLLDYEIEVVDPISNEKVKKPIYELINLQLLSKAIKGDTKAIDMVFDRIEGKANQPITAGLNITDLMKELGSNDSKPPSNTGTNK